MSTESALGRWNRQLNEITENGTRIEEIKKEHEILSQITNDGRVTDLKLND